MNATALPANFVGLKDPDDATRAAVAQYCDRHTAIVAVPLDDGTPIKSELKRRARAVSNSVMLALAERVTVEHIRRSASIPYTYDTGPHFRDTFSVDGIKCELWFKARCSGRERYDRSLKNRMVLRYGTPATRLCSGRQHSGPRCFEKSEGQNGFPVFKIVSELLEWVATRKVEVAEAAVFKAERAREEKIRQRVRARFDGAEKLLNGLFKEKWPSTAVFSARYRSYPSAAVGYNQTNVSFQNLTPAQVKRVLLAVNAMLAAEPDYVVAASDNKVIKDAVTKLEEGATEVEHPDAWLSWKPESQES